MIKIRFRKQKGLTLAELMVDVLLSTLVIAGLISLHINFKKNNNFQLDQIIISANAQAVYNLIKDDLSLSGFYGCESDPGNIEYAITPGFDYQLDTPISAYEANSTGLGSTINLTNPTPGWTPAFAGQMLTASPDIGSDIVTIRYVNTNPSAELATSSSGSSITITESAPDISSGDILLISDCLRTVVFQVNSILGTTITPTQSIGSINALGEIYKININSYYIKTANDVPALHRLQNGVEEALIPNIENMQLLFGQDTNNNGITDKFNLANNLSPDIITMIELGILVKSNNQHNQTVFATQYNLLNSGSTINTTININTADDKFLRKPFDFSLALPNSLI